MLVSDDPTDGRVEGNSADSHIAGASLDSAFARPRRWPLVLAGAALGVGGALLAQRMVSSSADSEALVAEPVELSLVEVVTTDLVEEVEWSGELTYRSEVSFTGGGGTITDVAPAGTVLSRGDVLVEEDRIPRVVLFGNTPSYRTMEEGLDGPDVLQLEQNLVELGYDTAGELNVDGYFSSYTETLVERWQLDLGVEETGTVPVEAVAIVTGPSVVRSVPVVGSQGIGTIASLAVAEDLRITVPVDVAESDDWAVGQVATVELVDESVVTATVEEVGTEITTDNAGSTIDVVLRLDDESQVSEGPVTVVVTGSTVEDAMVVPTSALVALVEGGFAVEKADSSGGAALVGVEIGAFKDGLVEVTAGDIEPGDQVVVPR